MRELFDLFFMKSQTDAPIGLRDFQLDETVEVTTSTETEEDDASLNWLNFANDSY